jgi:hypothetical protein
MSAVSRALGALAVVLPVLAACTSPPEAPQFAQITFEHEPDIEMDVADVVIRQDYAAPMASPNVDHLFPVRPADAAVAWARDRLVAAGDKGVATYIVTDASAVSENIETDQSLSDYFTTEQSERYTLRIEVEMRVERPDSQGSLSVSGKRSTTVAEDASVNDRRRTWYAMTEKLMADLNAELEETLKQDMSQYLLTDPAAGGQQARAD